MDLNIPFALTFLLNVLVVLLALAGLTLPILSLWRGIRNQQRSQLETQKVFDALLTGQRETNRLLSDLLDAGRQD
jgi:hypothetical protein